MSVSPTLALSPAGLFYYFGCVDVVGHNLFDTRLIGLGCNRAPDGLPWIPGGLDGKYPPKDKDQAQGICALVEKDGWTLIAFWDRSVDSRGGSNSCFIAKGAHDFSEMVRLFALHFPRVYSRFKFPLRPASTVAPQKI